MTLTPQTFTLKSLAVAALAYLDIPHADADIASSGISYAKYLDAQRWANLAAQEFADFGPWSFLARHFSSVTVPASAYRVDLPDDVHQLLSDPSYEDAFYIFQAVTVQHIQQLRAGVTSAGGSPPNLFALGYSTEDTAWAAATVWTLGAFCRPTAGEGPFRYEATAITGTGAPGGTEPTWPTAIGGTVTQTAGGNSVVWTCRRAGRRQLFIWPTNDATARTIKLAYAKVLPEMTAETDLPMMPPEYHRIVRLGVLAYAEEEGERNWESGARKAFAVGTAQAYSEAQGSTLGQVQLSRHAHFPAGPGSTGYNRMSDQSVTAP
jgi:hypothetical protein